MSRNVTLYPWFKFFQNLVFWQAVWFLYFQKELSAAEAIVLYAIYDIATTALEVPSGYMSDRIGRRMTLICAGIAGACGTALLAVGDGFAAFATAQVLLGAAAAFASGTDTSLLYESLAAEGRAEEIEPQSLRAWRFGFTGLAISAVLGGLMALSDDTWPFFAGAFAFVVALAISMLFREPPRSNNTGSEPTTQQLLASLKTALLHPVLIWLFSLAVLMYGFSHIPFVFGQPFILEALENTGFQSEAPLVSGVVSAIMMVLSVLTSLIALRLRQRIGLPAILLLAFGMQIGLAAVLAMTNSAIAIVLLFLRMVPNSLSQPFIQARIQPLLEDETRATYLSLQSFCGRLLFAASLFLASASVEADGPMAYGDIRQILFWYAAVGVGAFVALLLATRRVALEPVQSNKV